MFIPLMVPIAGSPKRIPQLSREVQEKCAHSIAEALSKLLGGE